MVDTGDLKSLASNGVRVQVPPRALTDHGFFGGLSEASLIEIISGSALFRDSCLLLAVASRQNYTLGYHESITFICFSGRVTCNND